jgi:ribonuclease P/MRP protein subunit RPP40
MDRKLFAWALSKGLINGRTSDWLPISAGVPQGSILGPLLFLIFINDIVDDVECDPFLYADDTCLLKALKNNPDIAPINNDLALISDWAAQWRVTFNAAKTVYMIFSKKLNRPAPLPLMFNGVPIVQVHTHCHLGLHFRDNMSWDAHVDHICSRVSRSISLLKRMSRKIDRKVKLFIYTMYIRPQLEYANVVYGSNITDVQVKRLEDIQRKALLSCRGAYQHTSHVRLLQECGIEPLAIRRKYFRLCHLYKMINGLTPRYLCALLPPYVYEVTPYPL